MGFYYVRIHNWELVFIKRLLVDFFFFLYKKNRAHKISGFEKQTWGFRAFLPMIILKNISCLFWKAELRFWGLFSPVIILKSISCFLYSSFILPLCLVKYSNWSYNIWSKERAQYDDPQPRAINLIIDTSYVKST